jgi:hypothetical protein
MSSLTARLAMAVTLGLLVTGTEWAGYSGRFRSTGITNAKNFADIWWHFFVWVAVFFALVALRQFGRRE